ncbi:MAG: hypothetical protein WA733_21780 [Methylocystis sp.]
MVTNLKLVEPEPDPDETALRHTLRRELEQRDAALAVRDKAAATVEAARGHLAAVEEELRQFDNLDDDIAASRATRIAESLEAGGGVPDLDTPELHALIVKRGEAANRLSAFRQAMTRLEASLAEAERTLAARRSNVASAALAVVGHIVDTHARELRHIEEAAAVLRKKLIGATALRPGAQTPLHPSTLAMLRDDPPNAILSRNDGSEARVWNGLFAELLNDPEARLND